VSEPFYPKVTTLRSVFAIANPSVICNVRVPYSQGVETFGNIYSPFCTVAILWPACRILRRSSQGKPSIGGVKRHRGSKIERCHVRVSHLFSWRVSCIILLVHAIQWNDESEALLLKVMIVIHHMVQRRTAQLSFHTHCQTGPQSLPSTWMTRN